MRYFLRSICPFLLALPLVLLMAPAARAMGCSECTPFDSCDQSCTFCLIETQDEGCQLERESTCGAGGSPCMQCAPNYVEVSREFRGSYDGNSLFSCTHHRVEWVTRSDVNQCNTDPAYWTVSTCEDTIDGNKSGFHPDCCNGFGPGGVPDSTYTCNGQHSC